MVTNGKVRVVRFFSKALVGPQLNWSVREKECYGIFYGVRLFEDLLDNRPFILKTDHMNLTYLKTSTSAMFPERRFTKEYQTHCLGCVNHMSAKPESEKKQGRTATLSALQPKQHLSSEDRSGPQLKRGPLGSCQVQAQAK